MQSMLNFGGKRFSLFLVRAFVYLHNKRAGWFWKCDIGKTVKDEKWGCIKQPVWLCWIFSRSLSISDGMREPCSKSEFSFISVPFFHRQQHIQQLESRRRRRKKFKTQLKAYNVDAIWLKTNCFCAPFLYMYMCTECSKNDAWASILLIYPSCVFV